MAQISDKNADIGQFAGPYQPKMADKDFFEKMGNGPRVGIASTSYHYGWIEEVWLSLTDA